MRVEPRQIDKADTGGVRGNRDNNEPAKKARLAFILTVVGVLAIFAIGVLSFEVLTLRRALGETLATRGNALRAGDEFPPVDLVATSGEVVRIEADVDQVKVLYLFTTTCPYCAASHAEVNRMQSQLGDNVETLGIALDGPELARSNLDLDAITWRVLAAPDRGIASALRIPQVPTILLLDADSRVVRTWTGQVTQTTVTDVVLASRPGSTSSAAE